MKHLYTDKELQSLSYEEIKTLLTATTLEGSVIFLDSIHKLEANLCILNDNSIMKINNPEAFKILEKKLITFKLLKLRGSHKILEERLKLEELIATRLATLESSFSTQFERLMIVNSENISKIENLINSQMRGLSDKIDKQISSINSQISSDILEKIALPLDKMQKVSNALKDELTENIRKINRTVNSIDTEKINNISNDLEDIVQVINEVME